MDVIPQNIKQFGNKICLFTSPSECSSRLTQTMMLSLTKLHDGRRCPFHLRKPTSTKHLNQFLKVQKPQSKTSFIRNNLSLFWEHNPGRRARGGNSLLDPATKWRALKYLQVWSPTAEGNHFLLPIPECMHRVKLFVAAGECSTPWVLRLCWVLCKSKALRFLLARPHFVLAWQFSSSLPTQPGNLPGV